MWLPAALTNARNTRFSLVVRKGSPRLSSLSSEEKVEAVNEPPTIVISQIVFMLEEIGSMKSQTSSPFKTQKT